MRAGVRGGGGGAARLILVAWAAACLPTAVARPGTRPPEPDTLATAERVRTLLAGARFDRAEAMARSLLRSAEHSSGSETPEVAAALDLLVETLWRGGRTSDPDTPVLAERAVALKERLGSSPLELATSLNNLGIVHSDRGEGDTARAAYQRALSIRRSALGRLNPEVARLENNLGLVCMDEGDYAAAESLFSHAAFARERASGPDDPEVALSLTNFAIALQATGDYARARITNERCVAIREKSLGPEHFLTGMSRSFLAGSLASLGDDDRALPLYERALATVEHALPAGHPAIARVLEDYGAALEASGRYEQARAVYERALVIREATHGPWHAHVAESLHRLAGALHALGETARAESLYLHATAIRERTLGPDHPEVAAGLEDLARLRQETGDRSGALALEERVLAIRLRALGPAHPDVGRVLGWIAARQLVEGRDSAAFDTAQIAESVSREHARLMARVLPERGALRFAAARTGSLDLLVSVACAASDSDRARRAWDAVIRARALVFDAMVARRRVGTARGDSVIGRLTAETAAARTRLANLIVHGPTDEPAERIRARLDRVREQAERAERALAEESANFRAEQSDRSVGFHEVAAALPAGSALLAYVRYRTSAGRSTAGGGRSRVDPGASSRDGAYGALILRADRTAPEAITLGRASEIDSLVARWSRAAGGIGRGLRRLHGAEASCRSAGRALGARIWDPVRGCVEGAERVFVVPDGALHLVNFAALPAGADRYLIESGPMLCELSAERDLVHSGGHEPPPPASFDLLLLAAPDFDAAEPANALAPQSALPEAAPWSAVDRVGRRRPECGDFRTLEFAPLPGTRLEARAVASLWNHARGGNSPAPGAKTRPAAASGPVRVRVLTDARATEESFKRDAPRSGVLHLATHGFFLGRGCTSALESAPDPKRDSGSPGAALARVLGESPLLLSGLALAGANRRAEADSLSEDGILTAEEIAGLDLRAVGLAVLSACETGAGQLAGGEGVFGLRRAFQLAGARSVLMSLWNVEDQSAREWMAEFYRSRMIRQLGCAAAVREASLAVLASRRRAGQSALPCSWAPFVATGEWR